MRIPASSLQTWCDGYGHYRAELRFDSPRLTMRTGLAEPQPTCLRLLSALLTCCFPLQVSLLSQSLS
jgi:hypothetical protein